MPGKDIALINGLHQRFFMNSELKKAEDIKVDRHSLYHCEYFNGDFGECAPIKDPEYITTIFNGYGQQVNIDAGKNRDDGVVTLSLLTDKTGVIETKSFNLNKPEDAEKAYQYIESFIRPLRP